MVAFLSRVGTPLLAAAVMTLAAAALGYFTLATVRAMVDAAAAQATDLEAARWQARIEKADAATARAAQAQAVSALTIETEANARVREVEQKLADMEKENAALPYGDACGLGRDRVRLLAR